MSHHRDPWCSNKACPCATAGPVCRNFEGFDKGIGRKFQGRYDAADKETWPFKYCLCCGWERKDHKTVIHNGRKAR